MSYLLNEMIDLAYCVEEPSVWSQPVSLDVGHSANFSCTVTFGGPQMDASSPPDTWGLFPQLSMSIGPDRPLDLSNALQRHDPGQPGSKKHRLTVVCICTVLNNKLSD